MYVCLLLTVLWKRYIRGTADARATVHLALSTWGGVGNPADWKCPSIDLSDAWGFLPSDSVFLWLTGPDSQATFKVEVSRVMADGRAGLRIGNINTLADDVRTAGLWPSKRVHLLQSDSHPDKDTVALNRCASNILASVDLESVSEQVVNDLFPVAHAVHEGAPVAVCMRLSIEYARLRVMRAIKDSARVWGGAVQQEDGETLQAKAISAQESLFLLWRKRCEAQLQMLGMCKSNGAYEMIPAVEKKYKCPFAVADQYSGGRYYVTPGCLVYSEGAFYDPCMMASKPCNGRKGSVSVASIRVESNRTILPFDPRMVGSGEALGLWPLEFFSHAGDEANNRMVGLVQDISEWESREGSLPWRIKKEFVQSNVARGGANLPGGVGNVPSNGFGWGAAEGWASDTSKFCDAMVDW